MVFEIKNKVALVTGGASGIGFAQVKQLLKSGAKGVVIADVNSEAGEEAAKPLKAEFGNGRVIFVKTEVSDLASYENAFKVTLERFQNIDILINNAGIARDDIWRKEIDTNLIGMINGMLLGFDKYLANYKQGDEAVILNSSSIVVIQPTPFLPVYTATKYAILGMTRCWGSAAHYERTKVRVLAICPAMTETAMSENVWEKTLGPPYRQLHEDVLAQYSPTIQNTEAVSTESMKLLAKAQTGTAWIIEGGQPAYQYIMPDKDSCKNNVLK